MKNDINYQQIYEEIITSSLKESLEWSERFYELSNHHRLIVEELIDAGFRQALEDALDPELLEATAELAGEMGSQLYNFANMLGAHLADQANGKED